MNDIPIEITAAARQLGVTRQTLHYHVQRGHLKVFKIGYMRVIEPAVWEDFKRRYSAGEWSR